MAKMGFGYNPPAGNRKLETVDSGTYMADLRRVLDVATPSFDSIWVSDHLNYTSEFRLECWTLLTWIAARYPDPRLGTIVMCNSFRSPSLMAKMAASLQWMSNGRFILGYGAGWYEKEYQTYGFDFPPPRQRVEMLDEAVQVMKTMWSDAPASFTGKYYRVEDVYSEPRPEPAPIIMLGTEGEKLGMRVVARYADWWNMILRPPDVRQHKLKVLREHCQAEGRDYDTLRKTLATSVFIDRSHRKAVEMAGARLTGPALAMAGDPVSVREQLSELAAEGFDYAVLTFPGFQDPTDLKLFADEVIPTLS